MYLSKTTKSRKPPKERKPIETPIKTATYQKDREKCYPLEPGNCGILSEPNTEWYVFSLTVTCQILNI